MTQADFRKRLLSVFVLMAIPVTMYYVTYSANETPDIYKKVAQPYLYSVPDNEIGCTELIDGFCKELYSPEARGNIDVSDGKTTFKIRQGRTENNFDSVWHSYYSAILKNYSNFPADLKKNIVKRNLPNRIKSLLSRPSKKQLTLDENISYTEFETEIDTQLSNAIDEIVLSRLEKLYPGTYRLNEDERPQEADLEYLRIQHRVWSQISMALWKNSPHWQQVQTTFKQLKIAFQKVIESKVNDPILKNKWLNKMNTLRLELPGQNPITATSQCISSSRNAHYYPYLNTLTVCAGYFNSGEQIQTLAHELSHALDNSSTLIDFQQKSNITKKLREVKNQVCRKKEFSCDAWVEFKNNYQKELVELDNYNPDMHSFHQCLQKRKPVRALTNEDFNEKSAEIVKERFSDMTENSSFFRIIDEKLTLPNGKLIDNPNYLNPCAYYLWDNDPFSLDAELFSLIFFTYELRCSKKESFEKIKDAISTSKVITTNILSSILKSEGEFSARNEFLAEALSSPSSERFADRLGSYVVAEYLNSLPTVTQKRSQYLVSSYWLCDKPSLRTKNYQLFHSLKDFIVDRTKHAENEERRLDWLSPQVMEQLACSADFEQNHCELSNHSPTPNL